MESTLCERFFFRCYWWHFRLSLTVKVCRKSRLTHRSLVASGRGRRCQFFTIDQLPGVVRQHGPYQNISAQIRGKIKNYAAAGKVQQGRLVVNGASMPQRIESDGSFARPYIFTEGSNSVQVISPDGQSRQKMQFYSTPVQERFVHVYGWFSRGIRTIPISISMLSRPMANTPGTVTRC